MTPEDVQKMIDEPALYFIGVLDNPKAGLVMMVSQGGKIYALSVDQELRPDGFNPRSFVAKKVALAPSERIITLADLPEDWILDPR